MRYLSGEEDWISPFLDAALLFSRFVALLRVDGDTLRLERTRIAGVEGTSPERLDVPLSAAPAFRNVIDSRDSVVALSAPGEISEPLWRLTLDGAGKVFLLPLVLSGNVAAILMADGGEPAALSGLELIATLAGAILEPRAAGPAPGLVSIRAETLNNRPKTTDHSHLELVRILANDDESLGPQHPGPRI